MDGRCSWRGVSGGITLETNEAFWQGPLGHQLAVVLEEWADDGLVVVDSVQKPSTLTLRDSLWRRLEEPLDEKQFEQRLLFEQLISPERFQWEIGCRSFVGAPRLELELRKAGMPILLEDSPVLGTPAPVLLTPEAFALRRLVATWNAEPTHSLAAQLELVGKLQEARARCAARGEAVTLEQHLDEFEIRRLPKVRLVWEPSSRKSDYFDLRAHLDVEGQEETTVLDDLDGSRPVAMGKGKRAIVLDEDTARVLRHVRARQQSRSRPEVGRVIHDPLAVLPEGVAPECIDLSEYSHRVAGFEPIARAARAEDIQSSGVRWFDASAPKDGPFLELDITSSPTIPPVRLRFETPEEVEQAGATLGRELQRANPTPVSLGGKEVVPTAPLKDRLSLELSIYRQGELSRQDGERVLPPPRLAAVIDEDAVFASDEGRKLLGNVPWAELETLLQPGVQLKEHQRGGLAWLWYHHGQGCPGVLLADDMGLGKTLQVACLLALAGRNREQAAPSLVIAPVALLDNWQSELRRFFRPEAIGQVVVLYGDELERARSGGGLDVERLRQASLVITNYETLARYQVALLKLDWNILVLDESHNIKNPDAIRTRAACGLKRRFAICVTGTPVENRLLDLWSLFFFLSPQAPFGARQDFASQAAEGAAFVRSALGYPSATSRVLRRTKAVLDLPPKRVQRHDIPMTPEQSSLEQSVVRNAGSSLGALGQLRKLYAHPLLLQDALGDEAEWSLESALRLSPKFARCLDILGEIRERGEKALVFSQFIRMQALLVQAIRSRFSLPRVAVINGDSNQAGRTTKVLEDFAASRGFDVLVLSPLAAGVGLNIVAANHVIHYDRWWNPAKEDQATDRAYRIGQTREVQVHYLLLQHPDASQASFDVRLHELVDRKRELARDFLAPADATEVKPSDLLRLVQEEGAR